MRTVNFHIKRYDSARDTKGSSRVQSFEIPYEASLTVLEGLFHVQEHQDPSLSFRYCCRASICGSCAMYINGRYRLACQTNVVHLHTDEVRIAPLPHVPLMKDLVCDMDEFFAKYEYVQPWLIRAGQAPAKEILQSPADRHKLNMPADCILCGACYSSCPSVWTEDNYLGPAALLRRTASRSTRATRRARSGCHAGTTSVAPTAATRSPTASRPAPRSSVPRRGSSGSRWRPSGGGCSAGRSDGGEAGPGGRGGGRRARAGDGAATSTRQV